MRKTAESIEEAKEARHTSARSASVATPQTVPEKSRRGMHPNSRKNLVAPWPKGVSGNVHGRPHDAAAKVARAVFESNEEVIYEAMAKAILKGNAYVFKELAERAYGKVAQAVEMSGPNGGPLQFSNLSREQMNARISELLKKMVTSDPQLAEQLRATLQEKQA